MKKNCAIVTAGATREYIDEVRYISNCSSGKQGCAIAESLVRNGWHVILILGKIDIDVPKNCEVYNVDSCDEMLDKCLTLLKNPTRLFIGVAAVCDWKVVVPDAIRKFKIPKNSMPSLNMQLTPDILRCVGMLESCRPELVVGFSLEEKFDVDSALRKMQNKRCDWLINNTIYSGHDDKFVFGNDCNKVYLIDHLHRIIPFAGSKKSISERIVGEVQYFFAYGSN